MATIIINLIGVIFCSVAVYSSAKAEKFGLVILMVLLVILNAVIIGKNLERYFSEKAETEYVVSSMYRVNDEKIKVFYTGFSETDYNAETSLLQKGDTCIFNGKGEMVRNVSLENRLRNK